MMPSERNFLIKEKTKSPGPSINKSVHYLKKCINKYTNTHFFYRNKYQKNKSAEFTYNIV